jgi:hypothetical protein
VVLKLVMLQEIGYANANAKIRLASTLSEFSSGDAASEENNN